MIEIIICSTETTFISFFTLLLICSISAQLKAQQKTVTIQPEKPTPGDTVTITYHTESPSAKIKSPDSLKLIFSYPPSISQPKIYEMEKDSNGWTINVPLSKHFTFNSFDFKSGKMVDKNKHLHLYDFFAYKNREPVKGAYLTKTLILKKQYPGTSNIKLDSIKVHLLKEELKLYPDNNDIRMKLYAYQLKLPHADSSAILKKTHKLALSIKKSLDNGQPEKLANSYISYIKSVKRLKKQTQPLDKAWDKEMFEKFSKERMNKVAPSLSHAVKLNGEPLDTAALQEKVIVLDFWATWCRPCKASFPHLQKVYEQFEDNPDVEFVVLDSGWNNILKEEKKWAKGQDYTLSFYYDKGSKITKAFGVKGIPTTFVIGKNGRIQFRDMGYNGPLMEKKLALKIDMVLGKLKNE
jgi:thiol-disulfide isomerase/thioredoxin